MTEIDRPGPFVRCPGCAMPVGPERKHCTGPRCPWLLCSCRAVFDPERGLGFNLTTEGRQ